MTSHRISVLGPDDLIDDLIRKDDLQAAKGTLPAREGGGAAAEPFTTIVAIATVVIAADKVYQASKIIGGVVFAWFEKKTKPEDKEFVECQLVIRRENGEEHILQFSARMSEEEIANQVKEFLE